MKQDLKDKIDIIYNTYGFETQKLKLVEELAELIKEIAKNNGENIAKELCDVFIVGLGILQNNPSLSEIFDKEVKFKVNRQIDRITKQEIFINIDSIFEKYQEKDWNGYSAAPMNKKQKDILKEFIKKLDFKDIIKPHIVPDPCGEIWLVWYNKDQLQKLTIAISKEGELTYSFRNKEDKKYNFVGEYHIDIDDIKISEYIKERLKNFNNKKEKND